MDVKESSVSRKAAALDVEMNDVIEILSSSDEDENDNGAKPAAAVRPKPARAAGSKVSSTQGLAKTNNQRNRGKTKTAQASARLPLQAGLVLEEDVDECVQEGETFHEMNDTKNSTAAKSQDESSDSDINSNNWTLASYIKHQEERKRQGQAVELFHDLAFESTPASIEGQARQNKVEKCRCTAAQGSAQPVALSYITRGPNKGRPYHHCPKAIKSARCKYFRWAFQAERMHWYRFGSHTGHVLVRDGGFSADDLLQGRVGDCWFLSALAVIAEREDLIARIFGGDLGASLNNPYGIVEVNLFLDGFWKRVTMDNFLPCIIGEKGEDELEAALKASMGQTGTNCDTTTNAFQGAGKTLTGKSFAEEKKQDEEESSSKYDPFAMSDKNRKVLANTENFLDEQKKAPVNPYAKKPPSQEAYRNHAKNNNIGDNSSSALPRKLNRVVTTEDLAYSKAKKQQLWVPLLEKAYSKCHGSYQAISGGWIAEAFLDLTGAPTMTYNLHNDQGFDPRGFWYKLLSYHRQSLPMGCGTSSSAQGIIGMHAYSIVDVKEIRNVGLDFFRDKMMDRTLGNVSGFTSFDGTVRLLKIRNPHGKGEWKGEWSDNCDVWRKLLQNNKDADMADLERSGRDDGKFWISYDDFLLGFSNVDVVLAFRGNCARSFRCNFPEKKSNHRCVRAFEINLLDNQPGVPSRDTVELYVMGIQKTKRGARGGRSDRKVSYKLSDFGILIGDTMDQSSQRDHDNKDDDEALTFQAVEGEMFGFKRNGHYRLILNRRKHKRLVVMPVSFGHPAATDKDRSFAVRFVADSPVFIRELPNVPRIDRVLQTFCFPRQPNFKTQQGRQKVLLEDNDGINLHGEPLFRVIQIDCLASGGGVVFIYVCVNQRLLDTKGISDFSLDLNMEATCRGMMCRTATGFLQHETLAKGKKFESSWRRYNANFECETSTRLLMVLVQSGQDSEMGAATFKRSEGKKIGGKVQAKISSSGKLSRNQNTDNFETLGIFSGSSMQTEEERAEMFGRNPRISSVSNTATNVDAFDLELERALALSRGDIEMSEALELSKHDVRSSGIIKPNAVATSVDDDLRLAIARSKVDTSGSLPRSSAHDEVVDIESYRDDDLGEAIKRSLQDSNKSSLKKAPTKTFREPDVLEVDDTESNDQKPSAVKKQKMHKEATVIEIIDDDDEHAGKIEERKKEAGEDSRHSAKDAIVEIVDKRRLAAEAAEKRFGLKND